MEFFYFFLFLVVIAGAFYALCCVKNVEDQVWDLYSEQMLENEMLSIFTDVADEMENDENPLS